MGTMQWLEHFRSSVDRDRTIDWSLGVHLSDDVRAPLLASLQTFQLGLSSSGHDLRTKVQAACSSEFSEAIELFIREKGVHAELLAKLLWEAGSRPRSRQWTDWVFRRLRHRFDWAGELMVLLTAELLGNPFFRTLSNAIDDELTRQVLASIVHDQRYHLGFHIDALRPELERRPVYERVAFQHSWAGFFSATMSVVLYDNRAVFEALGYDKHAFWTDAWNLFAQVQSGLFGSRQHAALLGRDPRLRFAI